MKTLLIPFAFAASALFAFANGGGYVSGVKFTGSVAPFQATGVESIRIAKEDLDLVLGANAAAVTVRYQMQNMSGESIRTRFGFPVEAYYERTGIGPGGPRSKRLTEEEVKRYCRNYKVTADGEKVAAVFQAERVPAIPGMEAFAGVGGWMVSEVKFPKSATRVVEITFDSNYHRNRYGVDGAGTIEPDTFRYRLSTGAVWNGPIVSGTVRVRIGSGVEASAVAINAPANRFKRHADGGWAWHFNDLDPTLADDIEIHASEQRYSSEDFTEGRNGFSEAYERVGKKWFWQHLDYKVAASSTLDGGSDQNYAADGVKNRDDYDERFRAWVEGKEGDGIGESLTLVQREPAPVTAILVRPGFGKSKMLFKANNRPKSLRVTLNGGHTFVADVKDQDTLQRIPVKDFTGDVKTVRLEIADVYRGTEYRDTAVSHIALLRPLNKEPKFQGPR